jgi:hypothetical protein
MDGKYLKRILARSLLLFPANKCQFFKFLDMIIEDELLSVLQEV